MFSVAWLLGGAVVTSFTCTSSNSWLSARSVASPPSETLWLAPMRHKVIGIVAFTTCHPHHMRQVVTDVVTLFVDQFFK